MLRTGEDVLHQTLLHNVPVFHDHHPVGKFAHQVQVMGDHQHRHAVVFLQAVNQVKNLAAHGDIQRGGGLVGQQQFGFAGQRHGNHGALALAAAELVRVSVGAPLWLGNAGVC